jgi:phage terminase large subunit
MAVPASLLAPKLRNLFLRQTPDGRVEYIPSRYKVGYGGRGSGKSWGFAGMACVLARRHPLRVVCIREVQSSIKESVHRLLSDRINHLGWSDFFRIQDKGIYGANGSEFIFFGVRTDPGKIKSLEAADLCLIEEGESISANSWRQLVPTIRKPGSEIWVVFNPRLESDETYKRFVLSPSPRARIEKVNWDDNPWFTPELDADRQELADRIAKATDDELRSELQAEYDHVWEGYCERHAAAAIFRKRVVIDEFDDPAPNTRIHFGADWGFANDPTALLRFWIHDDELYVSHEAFGYRVEIDDTPALFDAVPGARQWPIKADAARPETISYIRRKGFAIDAAEKWSGSVEDGIAHIKGFRRIHIHRRCKHLQEEARLYSYKVDRMSGDVLPVIVDKHNHGWDAIRYGLDGYIQRRGSASQWAQLGK